LPLRSSREVLGPALTFALALLLIAEPHRAACANAQAASPFPEVPLPDQKRPTYKAAYLALGTGVLLIGGSFVLAAEADDAYQQYLEETEIDQIGPLYDRTIKLDRLATGSLVTGELLLATGIYLRFLRPPHAALSLTLRPGRCALDYRF